jgi:hypothetical protein
MARIMVVLGCLMLGLAFLATPAHAQSPQAGKHAAIPVLSDRLCCECCASYGPCGCQICSLCPLTKPRGTERSISELDQLESLGVRVFRSSHPLMAGQSRKCPKVEALLEKK